MWACPQNNLVLRNINSTKVLRCLESSPTFRSRVAIGGKKKENKHPSKGQKLDSVCCTLELDARCQSLRHPTCCSTVAVSRKRSWGNSRTVWRRREEHSKGTKANSSSQAMFFVRCAWNGFDASCLTLAPNADQETIPRLISTILLITAWTFSHVPPELQHMMSYRST